MKLPDTFRTPDGFTVEGASPELLAELLNEYESELSSAGVPVSRALAPPADAEALVAAFESQGLNLPEELRVWWAWHNGLVQTAPRVPTRFNFLPFEQALRIYDESTFGTDSFSWHRGWLKITRGNNALAVRCDAHGSPLVRFVSPTGASTAPEDTETQVVSLCTAVSWWITAIRKGWAFRDPSAGEWAEWQLDTSEGPFEWLLTGVI